MRRRPRASLALMLALAGASALVWRAQQPAPTPLVFEAEVSLVAVDVTVVDREGRAILGLQPGDFEVEVDGRPRRVVSVDYVSAEPEPATAPVAAAADFSSNEAVASGRLVLIAVDQGSLRPGQGRTAIDSLDRLLDRLAPGDRVGLVTFPPPGPNVELSDDHAGVRAALGRVVGRARQRPEQFSLTEALAYDENRFEWEEAELRECPTSLPEQERDVCLNDLRGLVFSWLTDFRNASETALRSLRALFDALGQIDGSKTVVLLSQGLIVEGAGRLRELAAAAAESQASLYVLQVEEPGPDVTRGRAPLDDLLDRGLGTAGLDTLASLARGAVFNVAGGGERVFDRIGRELSGHYLIGFEPAPEDRDGEQHRIQVAALRDEAQVRLRRLLRIPPAGESRPDDERVLSRVLASPFPATGLPLRVASFATREAGEDGRLRVLLSAEIGRADSAPPRAAIAYVLRDALGAVVASGFRPAPPIAAAEGSGPARFLGAASVAPGRYRLRLAALDARGRRGSVEHDVVATLVAGGGLELSDLILAPLPGAGQALQPQPRRVAGAEPTLAYVELYGTPARLEQARLSLEVAESESSPPLLSQPAEALAADPPGPGRPARDDRRVARLLLQTSALPPGAYVARATLSLDGQPVAAVTRPLELRAAPAAAGSEADGLGLAELGPVLGRFELAQVLAPDVVTTFLADLPLGPGGPTPGVERALRSVEAGRLERLVDDLAAETSAAAAPLFLRAIGFLARGAVAPAIPQLEGALRAESSFLPAAFYLGACYAALGQDLQAAGAWQTALVAEEAPVLYALLADAWLRAGRAEAAVETLREGLARWPGQAELERRLGLALAATGPEAEALRLLDRQLQREPHDLAALFVTLRLLLRAHAAGRATPDDVDRLRRHGRAYLETEGPQRELVARWLAWVEGR